MSACVEIANRLETKIAEIQKIKREISSCEQYLKCISHKDFEKNKLYYTNTLSLNYSGNTWTNRFELKMDVKLTEEQIDEYVQKYLISMKELLEVKITEMEHLEHLMRDALLENKKRYL